MEILGHVPTNCGYNYLDDNGTDMIEYHTDSSYHFQDKLSACRFGGNLSVRKPIGSKAVVYIVGQDEAILKQFLFSHKMWVGPSGQRALLPKDEGSGTIVSAFVSRERSTIREISDMILDEVYEQSIRRCVLFSFISRFSCIIQVAIERSTLTC